jgi:hypothetical protein
MLCPPHNPQEQIGWVMPMEPEERDRLTRVEVKLDQVEKDVQTIQQDIAVIKGLLQQGKGGWRVVAVVGSLVMMGVGAAVVEFVRQLWK